MNKNRSSIKIILTSIILFSIAFVAHAQDCERQITQATKDYDAGQFKSAIDSVGKCLDNSSDQRERWQSLRLLSMAYLAINENDKAKAAAIKLLEINPKYKASALKDPSDFVKLINSIPIIPKFSLGLGFSAGQIFTTTPDITDAFYVSNQSKHYKGLNGFQFGLSSAYQINKSFGVAANIVVSNKNYEIDHSFTNWKLSAHEKLTYINVPVMVKYYIPVKTKIMPFAQIGGYAGYMIYGDNSFYATHESSESSYSLEHVSSLDRRNRMDYGITGGIGASYKYKEGQFFIEANYLRSFQNITNENVRYNYSDLFYNYFYLDDNLKLHNYSLSVGYSFYLNYKVLK